MSKGRRPRKAIDEAKDIAGGRGDVEELVSKRGAAFDFIINEPDRVVYVKVKRSQSSFTYALEVLHKYQREIASLHRVALTNVTAREFWVRAPDGTWQFFLIRHDSILEIRADGMYIPCEPIPVRTAEMSDVPADGADDDESPSEDPE
jgi:hypothetical protein